MAGLVSDSPSRPGAGGVAEISGEEALRQRSNHGGVGRGHTSYLRVGSRRFGHCCDLVNCSYKDWDESNSERGAGSLADHSVAPGSFSRASNLRSNVSECRQSLQLTTSTSKTHFGIAKVKIQLF